MVEVVEYPREVIERYIQERQVLELRVAELEAEKVARPVPRPIPTTPIRVGQPMPIPPDNCASVVERQLRAQLEAARVAMAKVLPPEHGPGGRAFDNWIEARRIVGLEHEYWVTRHRWNFMSKPPTNPVDRLELGLEEEKANG
jgi:hypothetical protein